MHEALERLVEDESVKGWEVAEEHSDTKVTLIKRKTGTLGGHAIIALLTVWWTLGLGNLVYLAYKYFIDADKKIIRHPEDTTPAAVHDTTVAQESQASTDV